jgi:hypothetical protein
VSQRNPQGITIVDRHPRRIAGTALKADDLRAIAKDYATDRLPYPDSSDLDYEDGSEYDELIAIWVDYFNRKYPPAPPDSALDPDVVKALLASESGFDTEAKNGQAIGIAQITRQTLKALQDPEGEIKDLYFKGIRQKDLKDPEVSIPLAVRWLFRKRMTAKSKLGRSPTPEEVIMEYKGWLKSKSAMSKIGLTTFRKHYATLKRKSPKS